MLSVSLAQVTDDLEEEREQVRRYLQQFGVTVLPERTYPQGGSEFQAAFTHDLAQADMFVQLLGPVSGKLPPDLPEGYTRFQLDAARSRGLELLQWRRPDLNPESVTNAPYRALLTAEPVIASGLESFKAEVLRQARAVPVLRREPPSSLIFINADRSDLPSPRRSRRVFTPPHAHSSAHARGRSEEVRAGIRGKLD